MSCQFYTFDFIHWNNSQSSHAAPFRKHGPCEIHEDGRVLFAQCNIHGVGNNRLNGPAMIYSNGFVIYFTGNRVLHRTNGPAKIFKDGSKEYWVSGIKLSADEFFLKYGVV